MESYNNLSYILENGKYMTTEHLWKYIFLNIDYISAKESQTILRYMLERSYKVEEVELESEHN